MASPAARIAAPARPTTMDVNCNPYTIRCISRADPSHSSRSALLSSAATPMPVIM
ncbi:hypothetical protein [Candidatus Spongiisocius sp.]|uniref:hypothetical protein n=1 Tax=Candidatus Spongiisocius sp. TaxID=3101273 RepID=UPI003B5BCEEE